MEIYQNNFFDHQNKFSIKYPPFVTPLFLELFHNFTWGLNSGIENQTCQYEKSVLKFSKKD